jgi:hypothetical protein
MCSHCLVLAKSRDTTSTSNGLNGVVSKVFPFLFPFHVGASVCREAAYGDVSIVSTFFVELRLIAWCVCRRGKSQYLLEVF